MTANINYYKVANSRKGLNSLQSKILVWGMKTLPKG